MNRAFRALLLFLFTAVLSTRQYILQYMLYLILIFELRSLLLSIYRSTYLLNNTRSGEQLRYFSLVLYIY